MMCTSSHARSAIVLVYTFFLVPFAYCQTQTIRVACKHKAAEGATRSAGEGDQGETCSPFRVKDYTFSVRGGAIVFGSDPRESGKTGTYALSRLYPLQDELEPIAPELASIDAKFVPDDNPAYNQGMLHVALVEGNEGVQGDHERPAFVTRRDPRSIYLLNSHNAMRTQVLGCRGVPDAQGRIVGGITALTGSPERVFYAARPWAGRFGDPGSGIGNVMLGFLDRPEDEKSTITQKGGGFFSYLAAAEPLDCTSSLVTVGGHLRSMNVNDMYWDPATARLYIALDVTGDTGGAKAIVVGRIVKFGHKDCTHEFKLAAFVPDEVVERDVLPVATPHPGERVNVHKVRSLSTTTGLSYLIGVGGRVDPSVSKRTVWALPLSTGTVEEEKHGSLAVSNAYSEDVFDTRRLFWGRFRPHPAQKASDVSDAQSAALYVGGGALLHGDITSLTVRGETVFVTIDTADMGYEPGLFYSKPLFNAQGDVISWTHWARARTSFDETDQIDPVSGMHLDVVNGHMVSVVNPPKRDTILRRTRWSEGDAHATGPLVAAVNDMFAGQRGGVFGVTNLSAHMPGLNNVSMQLLTGKGGVVLAHVGYNDAGQMRPYRGADFARIASYTDGVVDAVPDAKIMRFEGGELASLGPIVTGTVAASGADSWLFVGGNEGLCVLAHEDGRGCGPEGIGVDGAGINPGMRFYKVGSYRHVYRVVSDEQYLYIIAGNVLDRIDLRRWKRGSDEGIVRLVDGNQQDSPIGLATLFELLPSGKLMLLGTSTGLWRTGDGCDVRIAHNADDMHWTRIAMPGSTLPVMQLLAMSKTGYDQDITKYEGGQVYVLSSCLHKDNAYVHRIAIAPLADDDAVTEQTVQLFNDRFTQGTRSYFMSFGQFRNRIATDGSLFFSVHNRTLRVPTRITLAHPLYAPRVGNRFVGARSIDITAGIAPRDFVSTITRNEATGNWIIAGECGIRVCE